VIEIRRADPSDHVALSAIRRSAILELSVAAMSPSQAEQWANQATADRVTRAIQHHAVWVAVKGFRSGGSKWMRTEWRRSMSHLIAPDGAWAPASCCGLK